MSLLSALTSLPGPSYIHPIPSSPSIALRLNPYLPLAPHSTLFTNPSFLPSLPTPPAGSVIHILSATSTTPPTSPQNLVLISRTAQEGYDHALLSLRLAKEGTIVYHYISSSALDGPIEELSDVEEWLKSASVNGLSEAEKKAVDEEILVHAYETASLSLLKVARRAQRPFTQQPNPSGSSRLIINFLPTSLEEVDNVLDVSLAAPLPKEKMRHAVQGNESVVLVEGGSGKYGQAWAAIVDTLDGMDLPIRSILIASDDLSGLTEALDGSAAITRLGEPSSTHSIPTNSVTVPAAESTYTTLLSSSPSPLEILNDPSSLSSNESTSPLYAFGKAVALRAARNRLIELAKSVLRASDTRQELHEALAGWLLDGTESAGKKVEAAIGNSSIADEAEILKLGQEGHWAKKNLWIVISNSWAQDLASSGLHHALASGLDINLLVYETSPSPFSPLAPKTPPVERKKDLALYALNMGDVYVSSVAVYADYAGVINAMREAESYPGPGLVLAYLPWGEKEDDEDVGYGEKAGPLERLRETKRAVSGGWWPMFRWDPSVMDGEKRFQIDSPHIKQALSEFLDRQSHLSQLTNATPSISPGITNSVGTDLIAARKEKARKAYDALVNSLDGPGLLVLYASDSGNAEKVAKRLVSRAKMRGVAATIRVLDEIAGSIKESLAAEKNVVLITSTAGQGESPQNGREFYKSLAKLVSSNPDPDEDVSLEETKLSIFGMGDSNYWPRKEDYIYYNKVAKDLQPRLTSLGLSELSPLGLGDDSDPDGYQTGYKPWESSLWRGLGVDSVEVSESAQEETVANEHIKIASDYLRGTILEGLEDKTTGAIGASDAQLTKFHGTYMQVSETLHFTFLDVPFVWSGSSVSRFFVDIVDLTIYTVIFLHIRALLPTFTQRFTYFPASYPHIPLFPSRLSSPTPLPLLPSPARHRSLPSLSLTPWHSLTLACSLRRTTETSEIPSKPKVSNQPTHS